MSRESQPALPPAWVMVLGSIAIAVHLFFALISSLFASSGPWPTPMGSSEVLPPQFAISVGANLAEPYQRLLKATHSFRFPSIKQEMLEIGFEAIQRDANGNVVSKRVIPDPDASGAIRYRQQLLAQQLGNDIPLPPPQGVIIAAVGEKLPTLRWWSPDGDHRMVLKQDNANAVPRNQNFMQPSPWQYIVAKSFVRYQQRQNNLGHVEIIRSWYEPIMPMVLIEREAPTADILRRFQSSYGELSQ